MKKVKSVVDGGDVWLTTEIGPYQEEKQLQQPKFIMNTAANLAAEMVMKWGVVAAVPHGEDSSGRSQMQLMPPAQVVGRACETAERLMEEFRRLGWITDVPAPVVDAAE